MKKILRLFMLVASVVLCLSLTPLAYAAGDMPTPEVSASPSSLKADGSSKTTITVFVATFQCEPGGTTYFSRSEAPCGNPTANPSQGKPAAITVSGSSNTISGGSEGTNSVRYTTTGADGKATFTLSSTVAESKTITATYYESGSLFGPTAATTVTFTAATATPSPTKPKTTTPAPTTEPTPPEAPQASTLEIDGQTVTDTETLTIQEDESFTIGGKTVANGMIKLYIFSTPTEATVTADANGDWSYTVEGLEPGDHHIEAEVTDPATNKTSTRATLASFTISATPQTTASTDAPAKNNMWLWIVLVVVLLAGAGGFWFWWKKKQAGKPGATPPKNDTPTSNTPQNPTNPT